MYFIISHTALLNKESGGVGTIGSREIIKRLRVCTSSHSDRLCIVSVDHQSHVTSVVEISIYQGNRTVL